MLVDRIPDFLRGLGEKDILSVSDIIEVVRMQLISVALFFYLICFEPHVLRCTVCPFVEFLIHNLDLIVRVPDLLLDLRPLVHPVCFSSFCGEDEAKGLFRPKIDSDGVVVGVVFSWSLFDGSKIEASIRVHPVRLDVVPNCLFDPPCEKQ